MPSPAHASGKSPPRVTILSTGPLCRNPRVLKEATALGRHGYAVTVATVADSERFEAFDRAILTDAPFRKVVVDRASAQPSVRAARFLERAARWAAQRAVRLGLEHPITLGPAAALARLARREAADLTIVHTELPFHIGTQLLAQGFRVAADFEDWHSRDLLPSAQAHRPLRLIARAERHLLRQSTYTSAPTAAMADALQAAYGGARPIVIPNTFPLQPAAAPLPRGGPPSLFWFSQTIGEGRGLEPFLTAWVLTRAPSRVCLLGDISDSYRARLIGLLPPGRRGDLTFAPLTSPELLPSVIAQHDVGLALEANEPESRFLTATNKIFQYLNAGLAILATPTQGQKEVLTAAPGCGVLVDLRNPAAVAGQIDSLLDQPALLTAMGKAAREGAAQTYCWERSSVVLLETVARALGPARPSEGA